MKNDPLKTLAYFDVFDHPLKKAELMELLNFSQQQVLDDKLEKLKSNGICFEHKGYYSLQKNVSNLVEVRKRKEARAKKYLKKLPFYSKLISKFPFVRGIGVSGSLSKNVMHKDGDIDYFIITKKGRLWICRTLLILFKKIFLFNSRKYFCVNYFVDEDNLVIKDENIFTAIEVSYLLPVYNVDFIKDMRKKNSWILDYIPNFSNPIPFQVIEGEEKLKSMIESFLEAPWADRLDLFFMKLTYKRWRKKFKHFPKEKLELTMRTNRGISKHHPKDFQNKVINAYQERINKLSRLHENSLYT